MFIYLGQTTHLALLLSYVSTVRWDLEAKKYMIFDQINISQNIYGILHLHISYLADAFSEATGAQLSHHEIENIGNKILTYSPILPCSNAPTN